MDSYICHFAAIYICSGHPSEIELANHAIEVRPFKPVNNDDRVA